MPLFLIASAAEAKPAARRGDQPEPAAWRSIVSNLLAGALAGCAVEGGAWAAGRSAGWVGAAFTWPCSVPPRDH
jgi:hypothetical protein